MLVRLCLLIAPVAAGLVCQSCNKVADSHAPAKPTLSERVGNQLFHDTNLSEPHGASCASRHDPARAVGGTHGSTVGVAFGSVGGVPFSAPTPTSRSCRFLSFTYAR